jgi:hypothetical protein
MHSDLADGQRNVMLQFKSCRGAFSHQHADQNSFILEAFGHPLLIDSGYYPWAGSRHHGAWTVQTLAHNALLLDGKGQGGGSGADGRIVAFSTTPEFDYTAGDASAAYEKTKMVRHIVFVRPNVFVILDDIETNEPASVQFLLHAICPFEIDSDQRVVSVTNGPARAQIHLLEPGPVQISQTDKFTIPPERLDRPAVPPDHFDQWHCTANYAATDAARRLLTVIVVDRSDSEVLPPEIEQLTEPGTVGVRIGTTTVRFRLNMPNVAVSCRGVLPNGTPKWFEHTGTSPH